MFSRLISFFRSDMKQAMLKYFLFEIKESAESAGNRVFNGKFSARANPEGKINLAGQTGRLYGSHRSGWSFAVNSLRGLHNPGGIKVDGFVDRTFAADNRRKTVHSQPWIGFIHVPPHVPPWLNSVQTNSVIFESEAWKQSLASCRGLFTLSDYHRKALTPLFTFPVENLLHPTELPQLTWDWERFQANREKKIVQTGWWLRRVYSIYLLNVRNYRKVILLKKDADMERHLKLELEHTEGANRISRQVNDSVVRMNFLSNRRYDQLLSENIVFLDLIDASANNAIIECIVRNTPVLVNPIEPVVEYLGSDYPLYFTSLEEAAIKADNLELVRQAHQYLVRHPLKDKLTGNYFLESFIKSAIYKSL